MPTESALAGELNTRLRAEVRRVVAVSDEVLDPIIVAFLAGGHVLIEGIPGTGKTLLSRTLARCMDCDFKRIQFTNDLMPSDIVGSSIWRPTEERFEFVRGPLFSNIVLADEVNRTSSRTLSCLLEAMEEGRVSIEGESDPASRPLPHSRDAQPDRIPRHVSDSRSGARPLPGPRRARLPRRNQ